MALTDKKKASRKAPARRERQGQNARAAAKNADAGKSPKNDSSKPYISENPKITGYYSIILVLLFIILDRVTKIWALTLTKPMDLGILEFVYVTNTGAGFSILGNQNTLLSWIAVIALGIIIFYNEYFPRLGYVMILSGIVGNLIDRVFYGHVVDFINFKFWPIFNIADSLVFIGVVYTAIVWLRREKKDKAGKEKAGSERKAARKKHQRNR